MPSLTQVLAFANTYWYALPFVAAFVGAVWKLVPQEKRDAIEKQFPRVVGLIRLLYTIGPDVVGAWMTLRKQIVEGAPKR